MDPDLSTLDLISASEALRQHDITAIALAEACLRQIGATDETVGTSSYYYYIILLAFHNYLLTPRSSVILAAFSRYQWVALLVHHSCSRTPMSSATSQAAMYPEPSGVIPKG